MGDAAVVTMVMAVVMVSPSGAPPASVVRPEDLTNAQDYLWQFFTDKAVAPSSAHQRSSALSSVDNTLRKMQEFFGLKVTGQVDSSTLEVMAQRRCGVSDVTRFSHFDGQPKWDKTVLTYRITDYTPDLSQSEVDATIAKALQVYSDVIPLDFKQIPSGTADIMIMFKARDHGDFAPFDGENGVLAHAFSPGEGDGGDTHFDEDENWTLTLTGANLFLVAAHEFGHALGLAHSRVQTALMYPTYQYVPTEGYVLPHDDRIGVQAIYGVRDTSAQSANTSAPKPQPRPPEPEPPSVPALDRCSQKFIIDAATTIQSNLYFFKDRHFWRKSSHSDGVVKTRIQTVWPGISKVDAAYEYKKHNTVVFFEGRHFWEIRGNTVLPGFPKPLSDFGFPPSVTRVDAAVHVSFIGRTLLFVDNKYWSYSERRGKMDYGYPKLIQRGLPGLGRVDAAFENRGQLYFSRGSRLTAYNYQRRRVLRTLFSFSWIDCN